MQQPPREITAPPVTCRHYLQGCCLLSGQAAPGYDETVRCQHIYEFMRDWDDFLDRVEAFGLDEPTACGIWERLGEKKLSSPASCPGSAPPGVKEGRVRDFIDCPHQAEGICLLALPRCTGFCASYAKR